MKKRFLLVSVVFLALTTTSRTGVLFGAPNLQQSDVSVPYAEVLAEALNVRSGPGTEFPPLFTMKRGDGAYVVAVSTDKGWLGILLGEDGKGGCAFISSSKKYVSTSMLPVDDNTYQMWAQGVEDCTGSPPAAPAPAPAPSPQPAPPPCSCSGNLYNCPDFPTHAAAQACYNYCLKQVGYDVHWLDADNDGLACEWNP